MANSTNTILTQIKTALEKGINVKGYKSPNEPNVLVKLDNNDRLKVNAVIDGSYTGTLNVFDSSVNSTLNTTNSTLSTINNKVDDIKKLLISTRIGSNNNVYSGTLANNSSSSALNITLYTKSVLSYSDTSIGLNNTLQVLGSADGINYEYIGIIIPIVDTFTSKRYASTVLELEPFTSLIIKNTSNSSISGISCSLYSNTPMYNI